MEPPSRIARFEIERELGRGAMGVVYLAHDPRIDRRVAIKTIHKNESLPEAEAEEQRKRFLREAQAAGKLIHPGIVTIFDVGEDRGISYIAMEYIEGTTLEESTKPDTLLPVDAVLRLVIQACEALDHAHKFKIVHRDVKPANLMVAAGQRLKITDFGLAKNPSANLTSAGTLIGTPNYMSPEQIMGKSLDGRSDLFSLGVVLYELLTGEKPFGGDAISTIIYKVLHEIPKTPDLANPRVPAPISRVILKALEKDPAKRFQSGSEFAGAIRECLASASLQSRSSAILEGRAAIPGTERARTDASPTIAKPAAPLYRSARPAGRRQAAAPAPARKRSVFLPVLLVLLASGAGAGYYFYPRLEPILKRTLGIATPPEPGPARTPVKPPARIPGPAVDLPEPTPEGDTISIPVQTDPPGGRLYLDDREVLGGTILIGKDDTSPHTLVAENDCYVDSESVRASDANAIVVKLKTPKLHSVRVTSSPSGARILLDGRLEEARTPADLNLTACKPHTIGARLAGYQDTSKKFGEGTVWADVTPVKLELHELPEGYVSVKAPYDLDVMEGGRRIGSAGSPVKLTSGRHTLRYVNKSLFVDVAADVNVPAGGTVRPKVQLPGLGTLTIYANPGNGTVYLNGRKVGSPPILGMSLAEGTYQLKYVVESGPETERTVLVLAGQPRTEKIILKP